ncbi:MAG TPA: ABC transporter ATP-binding protein [Burkholderiaceae bacterium]|nr:ABC transporter ATP-binding protein [Burkholderiaceae bacterium]
MSDDIEIAVEGVSVSYGGLRALENVSLEVRLGELVCVIGANGAGKSTLLNTVCGLLRPTSGTVRFRGEPIAGMSPARLIRKGLVQIPEGRQLFTDLSVLDNLQLGAFARFFDDWRLLSGWRAHRAGRAYLDERLAFVYSIFPRLRERSTQRAGSMSGGEQQMVAVGRALMSQPRVLLLDEPSMGLAPALVREILALARRLRDAGLTVLLVEQNAAQALKIADRAYVLADGRVQKEGSAAALAGDPQVRDAYLGGRALRTEPAIAAGHEGAAT